MMRLRVPSSRDLDVTVKLHAGQSGWDAMMAKIGSCHCHLTAVICSDVYRGLNNFKISSCTEVTSAS